MQFMLTDIAVVLTALLGYRAAAMLSDYLRNRVVLGHGMRRREAAWRRQLGGAPTSRRSADS